MTSGLVVMLVSGRLDPELYCDPQGFGPSTTGIFFYQRSLCVGFTLLTLKWFTHRL